MADWGDVQAYNEMIDELGTFCKSIVEACGIMDTAATTCKDNMENDSKSLQAYTNVAKSEKMYLEAAQLAQRLANDLAEERDALIEYLNDDAGDGDAE